MSKVSLVILIIFTTSINAQIFNIKEFGAIGDGVTINTEAIQKAIDKCAEIGGVVYIPNGIFLTGSLVLKDNVNIYLSSGAILLGSSDLKDYKQLVPKDMASYSDLFLRWYSLLYAENARNISISGLGIIDGQGDKFIVTTKKKPERHRNRPYLIRLVKCKNVRVENVTLQNSAMWMQHYLACEDLIISGIRVYNHANQNNDMIDIDGCKNVFISDCLGDSDDDGITLKSTTNYITENVTITNCVISSHCNAIKLGTESNGGFRNITISNIVVKPSIDTDPIFGYPQGISGITLAMVDGGILEGITISNIRIEGTHVPIYMRLGNRARKYYDEQPQPGVGIFKNVMVSNVIATNVQSSIGCSITGIPGYNIQNISLNNITIEFPGGGTIEDSKKILPELENHYPESTKWGNLPAFGFYIRHASNINLNNIELRLKNYDLRPAIVCDDVENLKLIGLRTDSDSKAEKVISFRNVSNAIIQSCSLLSKANTFLELIGNQNKNISVTNNVLVNVKRIISNVMKNVVKVSNNIK